MRDFFTALESGWRAGRKQFLKRRTELRRDADLERKLANVSHAGLQWGPKELETLVKRGGPPLVFNTITPKVNAEPGPAPLAPMPADAVAELNEIRAILHPDGPETRPAVFQIRGPQDHAS